jgi:hypothetical protein
MVAHLFVEVGRDLGREIEIEVVRVGFKSRLLGDRGDEPDLNRRQFGPRKRHANQSDAERSLIENPPRAIR